MRKCVRIKIFLRWVGTEVFDIPSCKGLPNLDTFFTEFEDKVLEPQQFLALDLSLKATPTRWWVVHKQSISE